MTSARFPIPQGTLDRLILQTLSLEPAHGYAIAQRIQQVSREAVQVNQGSLYPALHRLEQKRWLKSAWRLLTSSEWFPSGSVRPNNRSLRCESLPFHSASAKQTALAVGYAEQSVLAPAVSARE
jgi:hypothetical protein